MLAKFKPTWMINSIYNISPNRLKQLGVKAVLSDLDNTIVPWNNKNATPQLINWLNQLKHEHIIFIIISNNKGKRIARVVQDLKLPFIGRALKPLPFGILRALKSFHLDKDNVIMVGDQLLTDIPAANFCHVRSVLVKPLVATDPWNTRINRFFEKKLKKRLLKIYPELHWQEDINGHK
ncbi:haloacid dehalogenase [Philodulcilactobacillus myokoensis]|uniref:Haloacid dehalogenase n=1 Tax=Philodulcilactobacillus myokoensis TaxID=2929573 RepID=A0A9W6B1E5_9LACO|nr:YqeG family HAD IIIA-type phosphatase [Philodulcilactobacillus myokoensis]GLB46756.1 haloacid dehalogenase [Philodulcilactobacillus myokoensis]